MLVNMHDGVADGRIDPSPLVVKFGAGADGVDDLVGRGHDVCGVLDDAFERMEDVAAALGAEPGGVDVTIDRRVVRDAVHTRKDFGAAPVQKVLLDGFAVRAAADAALELVAGEARGGAAAFASWRGVAGLARLRQTVRGRHCTEITALVVLSGPSCGSPCRVLRGAEFCPN